MFKLEDFIEKEVKGEFLYYHKYRYEWFGRFPNENSYYIPMCNIKFDSKEEVINYLNKR